MMSIRMIQFILFLFSLHGVFSKIGMDVSYDHRALLINGQRKLLISGSIHYPRSTPGMWRSILKLSKEAGIDVVETYAFWNLHQPEPGIFYFEDNANLFHFLDLCQEEGLYVNLRIGPFICAEWNFGGFPIWLKEIDGIVFRDYNEQFMAAMSLWMKELVELMSPYFAPNGGPIILAQIENEYGWLEKVYGINGTKYAQWCGSFANSLNIGIPWIMCSQDDVDTVIDTCNGFYCDNWIPGHFQKFPNQPAFWTENWPGWFQEWGEPIPSRPTEDIAFAVARWFSRGGSLMNYYMWQGGTNFGRWVGGPFIITSYDYDVALDEYGFPYEPKYSHLKQLHDLLHKYEDVILGIDIPTPKYPLKNFEIWSYSKGGRSLTFLCNIDQIHSQTVSFNQSTYTVLPWSVTLVNEKGQELFNTAQIKLSNQKNIRKDLKKDASLRINAIDSGIQVWHDKIGLRTSGNIIKNPSPLEQLSITHDKTDYLWYITNFTTPNAGNYQLSITQVNDFVYLFVDNQFFGSIRGPVVSKQFRVASGQHQLALLVMTMGLENIGVHMEQYARGITGPILINLNDITNKGWTMQPGLHGEELRVFTKEGSSLVQWAPYTPKSKYSPLTWYKFNFDMPEIVDTQGGYALDLLGMGKGSAWVNGHMIGRYWLIEAQGNCNICNYTRTYDPNQCRVGCGQPSQRYYHVPSDWLKAKDNLIVLLEEGGGNPEEITLTKRHGGIMCATNVQTPREDRISWFRCPPDTYIQSIDFASFGNPTGTCGNFKKGTCDASSTLEVVKKLCLGESFCNVPVSTTVFGNPCPGTTKSLYIQATCA